MGSFGIVLVAQISSTRGLLRIISRPLGMAMQLMVLTVLTKMTMKVKKEPPKLVLSKITTISADDHIYYINIYDRWSLVYGSTIWSTISEHFQLI